MKVLVIGGGVSSSIFAYQVKTSHPLWDVIIYESSDAILKRILISGNGRANFFNSSFLDRSAHLSFNNQSEYMRLIGYTYADRFLDLLSSKMSFMYYEDSSKRMYPFSNMSSSLKDILEKNLSRSGVKINLHAEAESIDPLNKEVLINNKPVSYDYLFLGLGGSAYDRDPRINEYIYKDLGLRYKKAEPALCPVIVDNRLSFNKLEGTRLKGELSLYKENKLIYKEDGELLFKKDSISGICVFDASLFITAPYTDYLIKFNPFRHDNKDCTAFDFTSDLEGLFPYKFCEYISSSHLQKIDAKSILSLLAFKVKNKYPLKASQISLGGIKTDQISDNLSLEKYPDIYVGGEMLDLHAICGGFNMGEAFLAGMKAAGSIK